MSTKLTSRSDIKRHLLVPYGFALSDENNAYQCWYILYDKEKVMRRSPVAMANLLAEYSFVDDIKVIADEVYVIYTPADDEQRTDLLEDFMRIFTQSDSINLIAEFEQRGFNKKEIAEETAKAKARYVSDMSLSELDELSKEFNSEL